MVRKISFALLLLTALSACGRNGALEAPSAIVTPSKSPAATSDPALATAPATTTKPDKPFLLDPLI